MPGKAPARGPAGHGDRPAPRTRSWTCSPTAGPRCRATSTRRPSPGRQERRSWSSPARPRRAGSRRISSGPSATSSPTSCAARTRRPATSSRRAACAITTTLDVEAPEDRREVGPGRGARAARARTRRRPPRRSGSRGSTRGCRNLRSKDVRNGALVALDYQTGELVAYVGSANYYATKSTPAVPAAVRRRRPGLPPARVRVQAVQLRDRHRRQADHRRVDVHGRRDGLRRRLHADRRRQPRARPGPRPERPPVLAQHPRRQGRWPSTAPDHVFDRGAGLRDGLPDGHDERRPRRSRSASRRSGRSTSSPPTGRWPTAARHRPHDDPVREGPDRHGRRRRRTCRRPASRSSSPQAAYIVTDILAGNTNPQHQPVLGQVRDRGPDGAGRRRSRPARTTTPRTSTPTATSRRRPEAGRPTARTRSRSGRGTATATTARVAPRRAGLLDRRHDLHLAGLPPGGDAKWPVTRLRASRRADPGEDRPVDRPARRPGGKAVTEWFIAGTEPKAACRPGRAAIDVRRGRPCRETSFENWMTADRTGSRRAETRARNASAGQPDPDAATSTTGRFRPYGELVGRAGRR